MKQIPVTVEGVRFPCLKDAMTAIGIPEKDRKNFHVRLMKMKMPAHYNGLVFTYQNGEITTRRAITPPVPINKKPKVKEETIFDDPGNEWDKYYGERPPLMHGICTLFIGVDHGSHYR